MATAVSISACAKDVKAGLPSSQARITLFRRGSSAIYLSPARVAPIGPSKRAEHMEQGAPGAIGILGTGLPAAGRGGNGFDNRGAPPTIRPDARRPRRHPSPATRETP